MWLDGAVEIDDRLWCFGFPDDFRAEGSSDSVSFLYEGETQSQYNPLLKLKNGQVRPGMSGAPLLNRQTGGVCGVIKATRNRGTDLGGRAIPTSTVVETFSDLGRVNDAFHDQDQTWFRARGLQPNSRGNLRASDWMVNPGERRSDRRSVPGSTGVSLSHYSSPMGVHGLPPRRIRSFVGREAELQAIESLLESSADEPCIVVVHGLSGIGKTQLCRKYLETHTAEYELVQWISADHESTMQASLARIAVEQRLSGADTRDTARSSAVAVQWLEQQSGWLLTYDNASPTLIELVLPSRGVGHILVPSTSPNWSSITSHEIRLRGLSQECNYVPKAANGL